MGILSFSIPDDILNYIPVYVVIFEFEPSKGYSTGRIIRCNKAASDIIGYTEEEMKNMGYHFLEMVIHPEDIKHYNNAISLLLNSEEKEYHNIIRLKPKKTNSFIPFNCICRIIYPIESDKPLYFICSFTHSDFENKNGYPDNNRNNYIESLKIIEYLSPREKEIAKLLTKGKTDKQIAEYLNISHLTVKTHRSKIKKKCKTHSTPELIHFLLSNNKMF